MMQWRLELWACPSLVRERGWGEEDRCGSPGAPVNDDKDFMWASRGSDM